MMSKPQNLSSLSTTTTCVQILMGILTCQSCVAAACDEPQSGRPAADACQGIHVLETIFGDSVIAANVLNIRQQAQGIGNNVDRFEFLNDWVLPPNAEANLRVSGQFVPYDVAQGEPGSSGGVLVSPVYDLLNIAAKLKRLDELHHRVTARQATDARRQRAQTALLVLIELHRGNTESAAANLDSLLKQVLHFSPESIHQQWPEMLVAYADVHHFPESRIATGLIEFLHAQRALEGIPQSTDVLHVHRASLMAQRRGQLQSPATPINSTTVKGWVPVERQRHQTRGSGYPEASWGWESDYGSHITGHEEDFLFFESPMRGDFDVDLELSPGGKTQVLSAGFLCSHTSDGGGLLMAS